MGIEEYDDRQLRCPKMGDYVPFKYCRTCGKPFCHMIVNCWAVKVDIGNFLAENYEAETIHESMKKPAGRVKNIIELTEKYRTS